MIFPDFCKKVDEAEKAAKAFGTSDAWALYTNAKDAVTFKVDQALIVLADSSEGARYAQTNAISTLAYFNAWLWRRGGTL